MGKNSQMYMYDHKDPYLKGKPLQFLRNILLRISGVLSESCIGVVKRTLWSAANNTTGHNIYKLSS